ncbi:NADPH-dependent 7-cyano-7-deazaguanine reductase QueF [Chitinibacteraceae bacterium HSL-7]
MSTPEHSPLGKAVAYITEYEPALLYPIARQGKRDELGLTGTLPFVGVDIWNGYELSWLNARGKPEVAIARFDIPADSPNIVESKSFKLYLNSFNQTRLAGADALKSLLCDDLSSTVGAPVRVELLAPDEFARQKIGELDGYCIDNLDIEVDTYAPQPGLLRCDDADAPVEEVLRSNLLKSNCLVTGQPDWASVQIRYTGQPINREALLRYLISFRSHNEFHEQCVERIFTDILRACAPLKLAIYARYTRRGGLDINPFRTNASGAWPANVRLARQ